MASATLTPVPDPPTTRQPTPWAKRPAIPVLHIINGEHYAGAERVQDLLALELPKHGFQIGLACLKPGQFPATRQARHAALHEVPMRGRFDLRPVWQLVRIARSHGYRLLHTHTARSALIGALVSNITGLPLVHHIHSPTARDTTSHCRARINALIERASLRRASALIPVSESLRQHVYDEGLSDAKTFVVHNGVPRQGPRPSRSAPRRNWTLGTVALFRPRKGIEVLLKALAILISEGLPVRLRAVGRFETGQYECRVKALSRELGLTGVIDWTGFSREVGAELERMDLIVLPSLFGEGLPMVVLEAMAAGVPVVATRVEGVPEAIRDGREGLIAEPGDAQDLASALRRVILGHADWQALRAAALERHRQRFSEQSMAAGVAAVYRRVLSGH